MARLDFFSPRSEGVLIDMTKEERETKMVDIFNSNVNNMDYCDIMIAVIDNYDPGTMIECGYYLKYKKPIFTYSANDYGLNIMLRQAVLCHNTTIEGLVRNLREYIEFRPITENSVLTKNVT